MRSVMIMRKNNREIVHQTVKMLVGKEIPFLQDPTRKNTSTFGPLGDIISSESWQQALSRRSYSQPLGKSFWTKCPQCGKIQALDQGLWAHVGNDLIYCCAECTFHQLISRNLVDFSSSALVDPIVGIVSCNQCDNLTMLVHLSGNAECLNCTQ